LSDFEAVFKSGIISQIVVVGVYIYVGVRNGGRHEWSCQSQFKAREDCPLRALVEISKTILPTGFTGPQRNEHRIKADPAKWQEDNGLINSDYCAKVLFFLQIWSHMLCFTSANVG